MRLFKLSTTWFDYVYYRLCLVYRYFNDPEAFSAITIVSLVKTLLICDCVLIVLAASMKLENIYLYSSTLGSAAGIFALLRLYFDWRFYKDRFQILHDKWQTETSSLKWRKGIMVVFTLIAPWIPPILIGQR